MRLGPRVSISSKRLPYCLEPIQANRKQGEIVFPPRFVQVTPMHRRMQGNPVRRCLILHSESSPVFWKKANLAPQLVKDAGHRQYLQTLTIAIRPMKMLGHEQKVMDLLEKQKLLPSFWDRCRASQKKAVELFFPQTFAKKKISWTSCKRWELNQNTFGGWRCDWAV